MSLKKLGRYDLVRVLGKGAMGVVYEGRDPNLERRVAIKTVKVENLSEEAATEYEARFRTEARSAARLQHPNIVSVYDSDRDLDIAYLVMEYIQGEDLKHYLDRGIRYSLEQSLKMIRDLLSALDYAHKQGIVHRDVKPANLLIEPGGRVKLTDFGVARMQDSGEATRTQGSMVGTLKYMSPEQVQGQKIDSRADLFSVGVVLYQLLTDKRPFDGDNDFSIIHQIIGHNPPPPSSFNARLPSAIDAVVARALAKDREQRFASARDFASALQSAMRRAQDQTVVPPADPLKRADAAGTGSKAQSAAGGTPTSGSSVTQEVELVYWKDVKDSTDPEELQGFLDKFPAGIYADLGRRRLRKLAGGNSSPDQTVLSGTVPGSPQDAQATQLRSGSTPSMVTATAAEAAAPSLEASAARAQPAPAPAAAAGVPAAGPPSPPPEEVAAQAQSEDSTLPPEARAAFASQGPPAATAALPSARRAVADALGRPAAAPSAAPARAQAPAPAVAPKTKAVPALAALAAVAAVGIGAFFLMGKSGQQETVAQPAAAASAAAAELPAAPAAVPAGTTLAVPTPPLMSAGVVEAAATASAPAAMPVSARRPASAAKSKVPTAPAPSMETVVPASPPPSLPPPPRPQPVRDDPRAAPPVAAQPSANPVEACKDKVFIMKELCLAEHCDKPGARNHPLCVTRRDEARLREESRIRN